MRSLFLFLLFIPFFAYSEIVTIRSGMNIEVMDLDPDNPAHTRFFEKYERNGNAWKGNLSKRLKMGLPVGQMSRNTLPVVLEHTVEKKAIMRGLFQNAKSVGKAAVGFAGKHVWFLMALGYVVPHLIPEGWKYNEDTMEFEKIITPDKPHYYIIKSNKSFGYSFPEGGGTQLKVQQICGQWGHQCTILSTVQGINQADQARLDVCKSMSIKVGNDTYKGDEINGNTGACQGRGYVITYLFLSQLQPQTITLTQDEFDRIILPVADLDPSEPVNYSRPTQNEAPPSFSYVGVTSTAGSSVETDPYTDPRDGKAKETKVTVNADGTTVTIKDTLRPDLQGQTDVAPVPTPLPDSETKPPTISASAPVQCDKYPDTLGCEKMGDGSEAEAIFDDIKIPEIANPAEFKLDNFLPSTGVCPAPKTITLSMGTIVHSYEKHCEAAEMLRPFIIIISSLIGLYLIIRSKD